MIKGFAGNDTLYGYAGNDTLIGGSGYDYLNGGSGNDLLIGGAVVPVNTYPITGNGTLVNGMGGPNGFGTNEIPPNDDRASDFIDLTSVFPDGLNFFGKTYTGIYLNTNGNITFAGPQGTPYTPYPIAGAATPIIAPFFADVDTRGGATGITPGGNSTGSNVIYYNLDTLNKVFTATWDDVGYYSFHTNKADAFQVSLVNRGDGNFDIVFRYENVNWTTGDASGGSNGLGGTIARAGFSSGGSSPVSFELPESGNQNQMLALNTLAGNTGTPGLWVFHVQNGSVLPPGNDTLIGGSGDDTLYGGNGNDLLIGGSGNNTLYGSAGNDSLIGGSGNTTYLFGNGWGRDTIQDSGGTNTVDLSNVSSNVFVKLTPGFGPEITDGFNTVSWNGNTTIQDAVGGSGNDTLIGNNGDNHLYGNSGNDVLIGGSGYFDYLDGGDGNDYLRAGSGSYNDLYGGSGNDTLIGGSGPDYLDGGNGNDYLRAGSGSYNFLEGGSGDDKLIGGSGLDYLYGGSGNDTLIGGSGTDHLSGDAPIGGLYGGDGNDYLRAGGGSFNYLDGGSGNDTLIGGSGSEDLYGGDGNDIILGGNGNNYINGGAGNDYLRAGTGNDTYSFATGDGVDTISDAGGTDLVSLFTQIPNQYIAMFRSGNNLQIGYAGDTQDLITVNNQFTSTGSIEKFETSNGKFLTNTDVNQVIQEMNAYAVSHGVTISSINDVKANMNLMNIINTAFHA